MKYLITLLFLIISFNSFAGEKLYFVQLKASNSKERSELARIIHIDSFQEKSVSSVVRERTYKELKEKFSKRILKSYLYKELSSTMANKRIEYGFPKNYELYRDVNEVNADLKKWAKEYPHIVKMKSLGKTYEKRDVWVMEITGYKGPKKESQLAGSLMVGNHHAREHLSTEVTLNILHHILKNYDKDKRIKDLVDSRMIYFIPQLNPDGAWYDIREKDFQMWRKNRRRRAYGDGTDLNRNYSMGWGDEKGQSRNQGSETYGGPYPFSEAETKFVRDFIVSKKNIKASISFHAFSELILYPWGGKKAYVDHRDGIVFKTMAGKMAEWNEYKPRHSFGLYQTNGEMCDWAYGVHGIFCFTFELPPKGMFSGGMFYPKPEMIGEATLENIEPTLYLIEKSSDPYSVIN
jgi:carboxypeptidase T